MQDEKKRNLLPNETFSFVAIEQHPSPNTNTRCVYHIIRTKTTNVKRLIRSTMRSHNLITVINTKYRSEGKMLYVRLCHQTFQRHSMAPRACRQQHQRVEIFRYPRNQRIFGNFLWFFFLSFFLFFGFSYRQMTMGFCSRNIFMFDANKQKILHFPCLSFQHHLSFFFWCAACNCAAGVYARVCQFVSFSKLLICIQNDISLSELSAAAHTICTARAAQCRTQNANINSNNLKTKKQKQYSPVDCYNFT